MKLKDMGIIAQILNIRFVGEPKPSGIYNRDEVEYFVWQLSKPLAVRCSTEPLMEAVECEELYMLPDVLDSDKWEKDADGHFIPGFKADFSKNKEIPIYQEQTIAAWARGQRKSEKEERTSGFLDRIKARRK